MADSGQKIAFYERRGFQGAVAVIGLLTAIWALVGAPKPWQVASEISASTVTLSNTEIVLDASASSARPFGGKTKLAAAKKAISSYVAPLSHEGLALRRAGGRCGEERDLTVGFGADHGEAVREAAYEQRAEGKSNIVEAVRAAADDFQEAGFKGPDTTNRILVFMNAANQCGGNAVREIHFALLDSGVDTVRIIVLHPSGREVKKLAAFKKGLASIAAVEISKPTTKKQLEHVVKREVRDARKATAAARKAVASSRGPGGEETGGRSDSSAQGRRGAGDTSNQSSDATGRSEKKNRQKEPRRNQRKPSHKRNWTEGECTQVRSEEAGAARAETTEAGSTEAEAGKKACPEEKPQNETTTTTPTTTSTTPSEEPKQSAPTGETTSPSTTP